jgi:hypothetical protein
MKKDVFLSVALMISALFVTVSISEAQVRIGGADEPNASAILDLNQSDQAEDATKGLALPRVSNLSDVTNPAKGLIVYNRQERKVYYFDGVFWKELATDSRDGVNPAPANRSSETDEAAAVAVKEQIKHLAETGQVQNDSPEYTMVRIENGKAVYGDADAGKTTGWAVYKTEDWLAADAKYANGTAFLYEDDAPAPLLFLPATSCPESGFDMAEHTTYTSK